MPLNHDSSRPAPLPEQPTVEIDGFPSGTYPSARCTMIVQAGFDKGQRYVFDKVRIRVGSDVLNDVVLSDPTVSRRHAEIIFDERGYRLRDLQSTNGTFVEDMRIREIYLEDGNTITFGKTPISFSAEVESCEIEPSNQTQFGEIVGQNKGLRQIFTVIDKVAPSNLHIVITGETGTGKELFARAIHERSRRATQPLVVFDCSAFPATLLESELFGHEKGSFSGATQQHRGVFEQANGGTLFLDELGEMSVDLQPKLLRAIETGEFRRVGGSKTVRVDVRIVAATNREIEERIQAGTFRRDLYYRLAQVRFHLPPLRERLDDISDLVDHFIALAGERLGLNESTPFFTSHALVVLTEYTWPGNVRELRNLVERAITLCDDDRVTASFVRQELGLSPAESANDALARESGEHVALAFEDQEGTAIPLREAKDLLVSDFEKRYLEKLLAKHQQNVSAAAREAKVDRRHFYRLLKKHGLDRES